MRAVSPLASFSLASAPLASSACTVAVWPLAAASMRAVLPCLGSFSLASAPLSNNSCTTGVLPLSAASIRGVNPLLSGALISAPFFSASSTAFLEAPSVTADGKDGGGDFPQAPSAIESKNDRTTSGRGTARMTQSSNRAHRHWQYANGIASRGVL